MLRWPEEAGRRGDLVKQGGPRLLLVAGDSAPPEIVDCLEDWVRVPATEEEVRARVDALSARGLSHGSAPRVNGEGPPPGLGSNATPHLDHYGVLRVGAAWVALPPLEARLTGALLDRVGTVTSREALLQAGWPEGAPGRNALDVHVLRMRRRLVPVGLAIRTVRSRGYLMEPAHG